MKKKLLFTCFAMALIGSVWSQNNEQPIPGSQISDELLNELNHQSAVRRMPGTNREEINGWVSFELTEYELVYGPDAFFTYGQVITPDSLPRVSFTGGVFSSFTQGFGQFFDPTAEDMQYSDSRLSPADPYSIDSIGFPCIYRRVNHNGIDDTLIITIAVTDKETEPGNPYEGNFWWSPSGLLSGDLYVIAPSYAGSAAHGYHHGLTGVSDAGNNVEIQQLKFALTEDDTEIFWRSFPVNIEAEADQVIYTYVEFKPSFTTTMDDTAFVFTGGEGEANTNSFRTIYDYPTAEQTGYFFDLYRDDYQSYNASFVSPTDLRYGAYTGDNAWRNDYLDVYSWWGFRFEYFMRATSSIGLEEEQANNQNLKVYPNPATENDVITISYNEAAIGSLTIQDVDGRIVYTETINSGTNQVQIDAKKMGLSAGIYVVTLAARDSNYSQKLIVH